MTVEIALIISSVSLGFALYQGITNMKRNSRQDTQKDTSSLTTVIVKLENIESGVAEIKSDIRNVKSEIKNHTERLITAEQKIAQLDEKIKTLSN